MKRITTIIADDEPAAIETIRQFILEFAPDIEIVATADNGLSAAQNIIEKKPHLVFLDIDMPQMNGVQIMEKLQGSDFMTIVTTGSTEHALKALKCNAVDYLLKPIDPFEFIAAIEKVNQRLLGRHQPAVESRPKKLQLPMQNEIVFIDERNILSISAKGSYSEVLTLDNQKVLISKGIGSMEKLLSERFFRCHNSHIINLDHIVKFISKDGYAVVMEDGSTIEVSRRSREALLKILAR